jgi:hypothetical protein
VNTIRTRLTLAAGVVIVALTAAAFWLSYAHLHDVAATYGLGGSMERAWAWPATLDLFIVAGEILMLVAALNGKRDPWAIGLTVAGSVGSILLNVLGVGQGAPVLTYVVAAVPPSAALLAFGALMRQLHTAVAAPAVEPLTVDTNVSLEDLDGAAYARKEAALEAPVAPAGTPVTLEDLLEELDAELATEAPEEDDQEEPVEVPVVTQVHRITSKPTVAEIAAAVEDIQRDGEELNGYALATYFGVSDRSGRRYLAAYQAA